MSQATRRLICACCGKWTRGRQWWCRDRGYGLCPSCGEGLLRVDGVEVTQRSYGIQGVHWGRDLERAETTQNTYQSCL